MGNGNARLERLRGGQQLLSFFFLPFILKKKENLI